MITNVLDKTPGLFFTLLLIAFVIGTMVDSILSAKKANKAKPPVTPVSK
ncbi:hypothetical protein ATCVMN08101_621L [Acanthocystis turfacea Chlorella virus MN0810.1]|nr:hypothetical protein ATCVMN08101_621L [Acanthocystis turfacea Chlorella virus MN0810.1]